MRDLGIQIGNSDSQSVQVPPLTGASWAANSEAYAELIRGHLCPGASWMDVGCGQRILEEDMEALEDWLVQQAGLVIGVDMNLRTHRNIRMLVQASAKALPFADSSFDLITCNMVVEHLARPRTAFLEISRCLKARGAVIIQTPHLLNYGVFANMMAAKLLPATLHRRMVHASDGREPESIFPVQYRANTVRRLVPLLGGCGLQVHKVLLLCQQEPFLRQTAALEKFLMKVTPVLRLLVCAHKTAS